MFDSARHIKSELILLLAAVIWGFAFVAQLVGMEYVGPFTFNGIRFILGAFVLLPFLVIRWRKNPRFAAIQYAPLRSKLLWGSLATGLLLFGGVALQQLGLQQTTAGKAGFITGMYVVFVPIAGIFTGHHTNAVMWIGALLAFSGLYFLSMSGHLSFAPGDQLVFLCAIVFTFHVILIAWLSPHMDSFLLAFIQFIICAILNLVAAFMLEQISCTSILQAWLPIVYGGVLSVGVAYTLQVMAQKTAHPVHASIILSLEAVFAVLGGWMLLDETLTLRMIFGCLLMLTGMIISQLETGTKMADIKKNKTTHRI
jgi:drug/metabolite transporter (DMT)-like permease